MRLKTALLIGAFLAMLAMPIGCGLTPEEQARIEQTVDHARQVTADTLASSKAVLADLEAQRDAAPPGSEHRETLDKLIVAAQEAVDEIEKYRDTAFGVLTAVQTGEIDPATSTAIGALPYGGFILAGLGIITAIQREAARRRAAEEADAARRRAEAAGDAVRELVKGIEHAKDDLDADARTALKTRLADYQSPETAALVASERAEE